VATAAASPEFEVSRLTNLQALWREAGLELVEGRRIDIEVSYAISMISGNRTRAWAARPPKLYARCRRPIMSGFAIGYVSHCRKTQTAASATARMPML
jgi:hypothetical protein